MASEVTLFRQEVIEFQQSERQWGNVVLLEPVSTKILAWSLVAAVALTIALLCIAQYARKETAVGYLTPSAGTAKIFLPQQGIVKEVHVREAEEVQKGQALLTVETAQIATDGQDVNASQLATLMSQREMLLRQLGTEQIRQASERQRLLATIKGFDAEVTHLNEQIRIQIDRIALSKSFVSSAAQLNSKGYMTGIEYKRRQQELLEQEQSLNSLNQQLATRNSQITETRFILEQLPMTMAERVREVKNDLSEVEQRIAETNRRRAYVIQAPSAGRISLLQARVGQAADPRRLQLEIVPLTTNLQAELFIPARAVGLVEVGQKVRILYDAFPYQKYGTYSGHITNLSQTILLNSDISAPVELKEPAYRATVVLDKTSIEIDGRSIPLQADMLLRADVILEKRTIMNWLIDPLLGAENIIDLADLKAAWTSWVAEPLLEATRMIRARLVDAQVLRRDENSAKDQQSMLQ
jgi:membrane fusion protein